MKILLVDDHPLIRRGVKDLLLEEFPHLVVGEVSTAREGLQQIREQDWDLIILDLNLPGGGGLGMLQDLKVLRPQQPVLVLSMFPEEQYATRVLKAGARGYVTKDNVPEELVKAVRKVLAGGKYVSSSLAELLASQIGEERPSLPHQALSDREFQILLLIASGKSRAEIAEELFLSVKTVSTYRARLLAKLGLRTTAELIQYVLQNQLLE